MDKDTFIMRAGYRNQFARLSMEERGELITAILDYENGLEPTFSSPILGMAFSFIKDDLDYNAGQYAKKCQQNRENIAKRWSKKQEDAGDTVVCEGENAGAKNTVVYEEETRIPNDSDSDSEGDNDSEVNNHPIVPRDFDDLSGLCVTDNARAAQEEVASWLEGRGYSCTLEVPVADRGDGRTGRIDLVAERGGNRVAIEIDRETPREKSLFKLRQFDCAKVVIVRNGTGKGNRTTLDGIKICYLSCEKDDLFDQFWAAYPKKRSKGAARKAWDKLHVNPTMQATILRAIERAKQSEDWQKDGGQYIPYPATWLNAEGWEDEEPGPDPPPDRPPVEMHWVVPNPDSDDWRDLVP